MISVEQQCLNNLDLMRVCAVGMHSSLKESVMIGDYELTKQDAINRMRKLEYHGTKTIEDTCIGKNCQNKGSDMIPKGESNND